MSSPQQLYAQSSDHVLEAIDEAAQMWGADWQAGPDGGRLILPVVQGLRHGVVELGLTLETSSAGTAVSFRIEDTAMVINGSALAILILGGLGGLTVALWPLSPKLLQLAPIGAVLAFVAWLLVVSRLRNSGPDDFFELVSNLIHHN